MQYKSGLGAAPFRGEEIIIIPSISITLLFPRLLLTSNSEAYSRRETLKGPGALKLGIVQVTTGTGQYRHCSDVRPAHRCNV